MSTQKQQKPNQNEAANEGSNKKRQKKKKMAKHSKFLLFALLVALIPFVWVGYLLIQASLQTGSPINGGRYLSDLNPAIVESQLTQVETKLKASEGVEQIQLSLVGSTLRIMVDIENDMTVDGAKKLGDELKDEVFGVLDVATYFTRSGIKKMYDLELYLVDQFASNDIDPQLNVLVHKTSGMDTTVIEVLSEPKNKEYVDALKEKEAEEGTDEESGGE